MDFIFYILNITCEDIINALDTFRLLLLDNCNCFAPAEVLPAPELVLNDNTPPLDIGFINDPLSARRVFSNAITDSPYVPAGLDPVVAAKNPLCNGCVPAEVLPAPELVLNNNNTPPSDIDDFQILVSCQDGSSKILHFPLNDFNGYFI